MTNPFNWFDRVYVISHPCTGRLEAITKTVKDQGIYCPTFIYAQCDDSLKISNMRRNPAIEFGVGLSHIKAVGDAMEGHYRALFLEDDIEFVDGANEILFDAIEELPPDWAILYLGGHPREPASRYSDHLAQVGRFSFAEAYVINKNWTWMFFDYWLDHVSYPNAMYDFILGEWAASTGLAFAVYPPVTHQPPNYSHIGNKQDDKRDLVRRGWETNLR